MIDRFDIEQVIRILGLEIRAEQADDGRDFDVACRIALEKLMKCNEYEDLEEQGLLIKLPCPIGTEVWTIMCGMTGKHPTLFKQSFEYSMIEHFGKSVFLTKDEAQNKKEEMSK